MSCERGVKNAQVNGVLATVLWGRGARGRAGRYHECTRRWDTEGAGLSTVEREARDLTMRAEAPALCAEILGLAREHNLAHPEQAVPEHALRTALRSVDSLSPRNLYAFSRLAQWARGLTPEKDPAGRCPPRCPRCQLYLASGDRCPDSACAEPAVGDAPPAGAAAGAGVGDKSGAEDEIVESPALVRACRELAAKDIEHMVVFDSSGRMLTRVKGNIGEVSLPDPEAMCDKLVVHNHPPNPLGACGGAPSQDDLFYHRQFNARQMRVVRGEPQGEYEAYVRVWTRPAGGWPSEERLRAELNRAFDTLFEKGYDPYTESFRDQQIFMASRAIGAEYILLGYERKDPVLKGTPGRKRNRKVA